MDETQRYFIEFITELKGSEKLGQILKLIKKVTKTIKELEQVSTKVPQVSFTTKGDKQVREFFDFVDKKTGKQYRVDVVTKISKKGQADIKTVVKDITKLPIKEPIDLSKAIDWKESLVKINEDFKQVSEVLNSNVIKTFSKSGKVVKQFEVIWKDKLGKTYKTVVEGVVDNNRLLTTSFKTLPYAVNDSVQKMSDFIKALRRVMIVVPIWFAFRRIFVSTLNLIKNSAKFLVDWEQQMARIRIVGMGTEEQLNSLSKSLLTIAKNLGISTKELGKSAVLWAQQGRTYSEIIPLMETTAKLSLITGRTMTQSVEDLTAIMKAYKIEAEDTGRILDALTGTVLKHAITAGVMVDALRNVAPVAKQFNISMEELMGIITAVHTVTRNKGSSIGRALRTIFARIATTATQTIQELAKVPVYLDENGKVSEVTTYRMRNLGDILAEIALKWNTLTEAQKINLAQAMAGKRRLTELMALMSNYNEVLKANLDALFSVGKGQEAVSILTDTFANRVEALSGAWKDLVSSLTDTSFAKGTVGLLTGMLESLSGLINPLRKEYEDYVKQIKNSNVALQQQMGIANGILEIWKMTRRYAEIFSRTPKLRNLEPKYVKMFSEYLKLAGIEVDKTINSMQDLANFMEKQIPTAVDKMTQSIHKQGINKIRLELKELATEIEKLISGMLNIPQARRIGIINPEEEQQIKNLQTAFTKLRNLQELSTAEIKSILTYLRNSSKTSEEWKNKLALVRKYMQIIRKLSKETKDDSKARIEAQAKVNALVSEETTKMITAEQARERIKQIELEAVRMGEKRLDTVNKIISFLQKENIVMDDNLRQKRDSLKLERERLIAQEKVENIQKKLKEIEIKGMAERKSSLEIAKEKYQYLKQIVGVSKDFISKQKDSLEIEIARKEAQAKLNLLKQEEENLLTALKSLGYDTLEIEIQRYELMKERGADAYELQNQQLKIQRQLLEEINQGAESLKGSFADAFGELLKHQKKVEDVFDAFINKIRDDIANAFGEGLSKQFLEMTNIGNLYGRGLTMLKFPGIETGNIDFQSTLRAYRIGADYTYQRILKAHIQGAEYFSRNIGQPLTEKALPTPTTTPTLPVTTGYYGRNLPNVQPAKVGFWGGLTPKQRIMAFGLGLLAGSGSGAVGAISSGLSSLFLASGHPLLALGSLLFGGLFRKKRTVVQETPKQIAGQQPLNLGIQVPSLPKLYALPQSYYFNANINVNIDRIQGEGTEIAEKIASEVSKATQEAFKQSYVRNITRAILPKGFVF